MLLMIEKGKPGILEISRFFESFKKFAMMQVQGLQSSE
jgi:hypothetical protein